MRTSDLNARSQRHLVMQTKTTVRTIALLCASGAITACYTYTPISLDRLQPGMEIRAHLTGAGLDRVRRVPEQRFFDRLELSGAVMDVNTDTIALIVPSNVFDGAAAADLRRTIALGRADFDVTELRRLNRRKTALAIGGGALLVTVAIVRMRGNGLWTPNSTTVSPSENRQPARH
jgi:hypothetical protein